MLHEDRPGITLAYSQPVAAVKSDVLDVSAPAVLRTDRLHLDLGGTATPTLTHARDAVEVLQTPLSQCTVSIVPGANHVDCVDVPFSPSCHLESIQEVESFRMLVLTVKTFEVLLEGSICHKSIHYIDKRIGRPVVFTGIGHISHTHC